VPGRAEIVRLRKGDCARAAACLPMLAAGGPGADDSLDDEAAAATSHLAQCLRCQAEMVAYRRLLRHLRALRRDEVSPPAGAVAAVLASLRAAALEDQSSGPHRALRVAYVGGLTVATAAATTAGVLVWMSRRRLAETG
jgi:hypothetical protein